MNNEEALAQCEQNREDKLTEEVPCNMCGYVECNCDEEENMEMTLDSMDRF